MLRNQQFLPLLTSKERKATMKKPSPSKATSAAGISRSFCIGPSGKNVLILEWIWLWLKVQLCSTYIWFVCRQANKVKKLMSKGFYKGKGNTEVFWLHLVKQLNWKFKLQENNSQWTNDLPLDCNHFNWTFLFLQSDFSPIISKIQKSLNK